MTDKCFIENETYTTKDDNCRFKYNIYATHDYQPMVMYYKDGTGDPGCDDYEIDDINLYDFEIYNPATEEFESFEPVKEQIALFKKELEEYILDHTDLFSFEDCLEDYEEF